MKKRTLFLIVALLALATSSTYAFRHYRTDYERYEENESYSIEYDFRHLRKKFNAADEQGKVAILKTVFKEGWVLEGDRHDEKGQLCNLCDSRGAFDNKTLKAQDLLNLSPESRYELLLAAKEIVADDQTWRWYTRWVGKTPERMKIFALWMKNAQSIGKDQELKSFVKEYLLKSAYNRDDVIACYLAYCSLSDNEFGQITVSMVSGMGSIKSNSDTAFPMENYDVEYLTLIQKIAEQKLLPERNMSSLVEVLGELFAKIPPFKLEAVTKKKSRFRYDSSGHAYFALGDIDSRTSALFGESDQPKVIGYKPKPFKTNRELADTLKAIARKYRTLRPQIDPMLKADATRRKNYDKSPVDGIMWDHSK